MPSPFPGMDPYLENVIRWNSVRLADYSGPTCQESGRAGFKKLSIPFLGTSHGSQLALHTLTPDEDAPRYRT